MKVGELVLILQGIRELRSIPWVSGSLEGRRTTVDPTVYRRPKVNPISFGRTKVDPLKIGELLSIIQCIGELRSILWVSG